jgi:hypothetical protein
MSGLLTFAPGWNLKVPAGTVVVRADVVMNQRPGAGGFAAVVESSDSQETVLLRGGSPDTDTEAMIMVLITELAKEIRGNRAVVMTRNQPIGRAVSDAFKRFKMVRMVLNAPLAVSDATRHAHVMAERAQGTRRDHHDRLLFSKFEPKEDRTDNQDSGGVHAAIQTLINATDGANVNSEAVRKASQAYMDACHVEVKAKEQELLRSLTANDVPRRVKEI